MPHEYYVIGFMEDGERVLSCKNQEYTITRGDVLLFNPGDNHACAQSDGGTLQEQQIFLFAKLIGAFHHQFMERAQIAGDFFIKDYILGPGIYRDIFKDTEEMPHEG